MSTKIPNILVTGTPGAGKTHFAKEIAKVYGMNFVEVSRVVQEHEFTSGYDEVRKCQQEIFKLFLSCMTNLLLILSNSN